MRFLFVFISPFYNFLIRAIATGPWGPLHQLFILIFSRLYKIPLQNPQQYKTLQDFFLRSEVFPIAERALVSPVSCYVLESAIDMGVTESTVVKGLKYAWEDFAELDLTPFRSGKFWNLYLAPKHYHWFHSPVASATCKAIRHAGKSFPVNALGRNLCPKLYTENERLTFQFETPEFGRVLMITIGALAVSRIRSEKGSVPYGQWVELGPVQKAERLGAFELGSSALLIVEKLGNFRRLDESLRVGESLL